jgi:hypothetical protein
MRAPLSTRSLELGDKDGKGSRRSPSPTEKHRLASTPINKIMRTQRASNAGYPVRI